MTVWIFKNALFFKLSFQKENNCKKIWIVLRNTISYWNLKHKLLLMDTSCFIKISFATSNLAFPKVILGCCRIFFFYCSLKSRLIHCKTDKWSSIWTDLEYFDWLNVQIWFQKSLLKLWRFINYISCLQKVIWSVLRLAKNAIDNGGWVLCY